MKEYLSGIHPIEEAVLQAYLQAWSEHRVPAKTIMTWEGDVERYMYYVLEGIQKSYHLDSGKENIIAFTYAPSFSGIPESFFAQAPSKYFLSTITESRFLRISHEDHQALMAKHRQIETLFRKATELLLIGVLERYHELMAFNIETRLKLFLERSPHLLNMVSRKDLASYLRIDATNLSKLLNSR